MNKTLDLLKTALLVLLTTQQMCWATDYYPMAPAASSVDGAGGNNAEQVNMAIAQSDLPAASRNVTATYKNGAIVLNGTVPSDRDRLEIGSIAARCGCVNIKNEITVLSSTKSSTKRTAPQK